MSLVKKINLDNLTNFSRDNSYLSIVERKKPNNAKVFFKELLKKPLNLSIVIEKKTILEDIRFVLNKNLSIKIQNNNFYNIWLKDMEKIINLFCVTINENFLKLSLETSRGCKRYHIDNVPIRLLVTYHGKGTEWFPSTACDYSAYYSGKKNEKIIINQNERRFLKPWHIAIFKGQKSIDGGKGILHRSPDEAIDGKSLLMRLDKAKEYT